MPAIAANPPPATIHISTFSTRPRPTFGDCIRVGIGKLTDDLEPGVAAGVIPERLALVGCASA